MIKSIADLAEKLQKLGEPEKGYTRFFRGHSDESYILEPSIYRQNDCKIDYEDQIIRDAFTYCSNSFLPHETLFEKLAKLQHYNYKTRLLDVSSNASVALYFSIGKSDKQEISHSDKNGEIVILDIPNEHIKYDDSDVV
ncbi:FRG domain-containing protein, partial [Rodentibacter caecimuris]|uniref:FRG domain-containing protein n=1 Tax=Rodentibacter caecimuris TaxID=1796644 RepID=UPI00101AE873